MRLPRYQNRARPVLGRLPVAAAAVPYAVGAAAALEAGEQLQQVGEERYRQQAEQQFTDAMLGAARTLQDWRAENADASPEVYDQFTEELEATTLLEIDNEDAQKLFSNKWRQAALREREQVVRDDFEARAVKAQTSAWEVLRQTRNVDAAIAAAGSMVTQKGRAIMREEMTQWLVVEDIRDAFLSYQTPGEARAAYESFKSHKPADIDHDTHQALVRELGIRVNQLQASFELANSERSAMAQTLAAKGLLSPELIEEARRDQILTDKQAAAGALNWQQNQPDLTTQARNTSALQGYGMIGEDAKSKKDANLRYDNVITAQGVDPYSPAGLAFARRFTEAGFLPNSLGERLYNDLMSAGTTPEEKARAAQAAEFLFRDTGVMVARLPEDYKSVVYRAARLADSPNISEAMEGIRLLHTQDEQQTRLADYKNRTLGKGNFEALQDFVNDEWDPFFGAEPKNAEVMTAEFNDRVELYYALNEGIGVEEAQELAWRDVKSLYGVEKIKGEPRIMRLGPAHVTRLPDKEIEKQFRKDMEALGYDPDRVAIVSDLTTEFGVPIAGEKPTTWALFELSDQGLYTGTPVLNEDGSNARWAPSTPIQKRSDSGLEGLDIPNIEQGMEEILDATFPHRHRTPEEVREMQLRIQEERSADPAEAWKRAAVEGARRVLSEFKPGRYTEAYNRMLEQQE